MSYASRSLYNESNSASSVQTRTALRNIVVQLLQDTSIKAFKNAVLTESSIDNTSIGANVPSLGHFSSLAVGFPNLNTSVVVYGPKSSSVNWSATTLAIANATLQLNDTNINSSGDLAVSSASKLSLNALNSINISAPSLNLTNSTPIKWDNLASINQGSQLNSIVLSDPIPLVGSPQNLVTDSGIQLTLSSSQTYFLGQTISKRLITHNDRSLQFLANPVINVSNNMTDKSIQANTGTTATGAEFGNLAAERLFVSYEKIFISASSLPITINSSKLITKIYGSDNVSSVQITLPNGDDDGQIKCIQWLPPTLGFGSLSLPMNTTNLSIIGNFCFPTYQNEQAARSNGSITNVYTALISGNQNKLMLNSQGSSVSLVFDTTLQSWCLYSTGIQ